MVVDAMVALANPSQAKNNKLVSLAKSVDKDNDGLMDLQNPDWRAKWTDRVLKTLRNNLLK